MIFGQALAASAARRRAYQRVDLVGKEPDPPGAHFDRPHAPDLAIRARHERIAVASIDAILGELRQPVADPRCGGFFRSIRDIKLYSRMTPHARGRSRSQLITMSAVQGK
jgi:hypothetical protein